MHTCRVIWCVLFVLAAAFFLATAQCAVALSQCLRVLTSRSFWGSSQVIPCNVRAWKKGKKVVTSPEGEGESASERGRPSSSFPAISRLTSPQGSVASIVDLPGLPGDVYDSGHKNQEMKFDTDVASVALADAHGAAMASSHTNNLSAEKSLPVSSHDRFAGSVSRKV